MSNRYNEMFLEDHFERGIAMGMDDDEAERFAWASFNEEEYEPVDPNKDLEEGQCICGKFECGETYVHWSSGW